MSVNEILTPGRRRPRRLAPSQQRRRAANRAAFLALYPVPGPADSVPLTPGERAGARRCPNMLPGGIPCARPPERGKRSLIDGRVYLRCRNHDAWYSMPPDDGELLRPLASFTWAEVMNLPRRHA